ncbi:MAG TPA: stage II sporulation protein M [Anaerolineales bacterium]|nr:stage II sporulation protein M [Anaerolineales bacterium]
MLDDARMVWLVAGRELHDQLRDWRILSPLLVLTLAFPFLMNVVARQAVSFFAQYGTDLIADRLIPFSILIIGFFPITISLVVALESFVGEKERGTIEPLLSAPLRNAHLYFGKLVIGVLTPLLGSYLAITLYLLMVSQHGLHLPDPGTLLLLYTLTTAHAILMVSAAIVISVQSTTVRAANLLASFIVIPVAILMQGESVLLFWGTDRVLWLAVAGVLILAGLLVRLGLSHFQREYLLGREFDTLNFHWIAVTFWSAFRGQNRSLAAWYASDVRRVLGQLRLPLLLTLLMAAIGFGASYRWATLNIPHLLSSATTRDFTSLIQDARQSVGLVQAHQKLSASFIFLNNMRATFLVFVAGLFSFSVLGMLLYLLNVGLVGGVLGIFKLIGFAPAVLFAAGLLPHGIFEIPALMLATAVVLRMGAVLVTPQTGKSMGQIVLEQLADWLKIFLGLVVPLLALAALVEAYVTPLILSAAIK